MNARDPRPPRAPVFSGDLTLERVDRHGDLARLRFPVPDAFLGARAGQFALLSSNRRGAPLLGRPISIILRDGLEFEFACVGEGTRILAEAQPGERVFVTGPLGNAFNDAAAASLIVCDATHFGTFVSLGLERQLAGSPAHLLYVRSEGQVAALDAPVLDWLRPVVNGVDVVSLAELPDALRPRADRLIAVGARDPVMACVARHADEHGYPAEAAVQAPMACGLGVCKVCIRPRHAGGTFLVCETPIVPVGVPVFAP